MPAIISNGMLLLFEVRCIAAWKIRRVFGWGDFAAPLERMDPNCLVLGCSLRWREKKEGRMEDERMSGDLSPGRWWPIPDHLAFCQGQVINAALLWLLQTAWGYSRPADSWKSIQYGKVSQCKEETALTKVQAWVTLLTYRAVINIRKSKPLCLIIFAFA